MTALEAARLCDWPACLSALLELWRAHRTPELAALIDLASERARGLEVAPRSIGKRIASATDIDVVPIVDVIRRQLRTQPSFAAHAIELAKTRPPDPRIATLLAEIFERSPYSSGHGPLDRRVLDQLVAIDDPRYRELIAREAERYRARRSRFPRRLAAIDHLIAVAAKLPGRPAPTPIAIDGELRELLERGPVRAGIDTLYAAVYANPGEVASRIVLGDALIELGDPRGEFIALQCGRADAATPTRRERELLAANGRVWLEGAEKYIRKDGVVYRRGFVACARLNDIRGRTHDRVWRTIEELDVGGLWMDDALPTWLPTLPVLRRVWRLPAARWDSVLAVPHPWTALGLTGVFANTFQQLGDARENFAGLVELDLAPWGGNLAALADSAIASQLQRVRIAIPSRLLAHVNAVAGTSLRELDVVPRYSFPPLEEGPIARFASRRLELIARAPQDMRYLLLLLRALDVGSITAATITAPPTADTRALVAELQRLHVTS
jgi:uncharacterized protein (TIGR02996 family)